MGTSHSGNGLPHNGKRPLPSGFDVKTDGPNLFFPAPVDPQSQWFALY